MDWVGKSDPNAAAFYHKARAVCYIIYSNGYNLLCVILYAVCYIIYSYIIYYNSNKLGEFVVI